MSINAIGQNRVVPVSEDLTTPDDRFEVIRGNGTMFRRDAAFAEGAVFELGDWGVLGADGKVEEPGASAVAETYPILAGNDRFDAHATGQVTLAQGSNIIARTSKFHTGDSYAVGDALTVKSGGAGRKVVCKQAGAEPVLARVLEVGTNYLVINVFPSTVGN